MSGRRRRHGIGEATPLREEKPEAPRRTEDYTSGVPCYRSANRDIGTTRRGSLRVLIVEDDPSVADLLDRTVRQATWAADIASSGSLALEALAVHPYDLVILDRGLPDMDGLAVCRRWRAQGGKAPVLVLTARGALAERVEGLDSGADDYLVKPFAAEELLARLRA